jgi:hypothetical protein
MGYKDEMARMVVESLDIKLEPGDIPDVDASAWLSL